VDSFTSPLHVVEAALVAAILLICVITDIRSRKIYNWVTFPAMLAGLVINVWRNGPTGILTSLEGFGVGLIALILMAVLQLVAIAPMRFADVKLLCAIGMITGPHFGLYTLILTAICGGVLGLIYAAQRGVLKDTVTNLKVALQVSAAIQSSDGLKHMVDSSKAGYMPYAPAIACGAVAAWIGIRLGWFPG